MIEVPDCCVGCVGHRKQLILGGFKFWVVVLLVGVDGFVIGVGVIGEVDDVVESDERCSCHVRNHVVDRNIVIHRSKRICNKIAMVQAEWDRFLTSRLMEVGSNEVKKSSMDRMMRRKKGKSSNAYEEGALSRMVSFDFGGGE